MVNGFVVVSAGSVRIGHPDSETEGPDCTGRPGDRSGGRVQVQSIRQRTATNGPIVWQNAPVCRYYCRIGYPYWPTRQRRSGDGERYVLVGGGVSSRCRRKKGVFDALDGIGREGNITA